MQYNRIIRMLLTLILTASVLTGCGCSIPHDSTIDSTESEESNASISASEETENPFETGEDSEALGGSSQEFLNVELNEADETIPFTYSGGKMEVEFQYSGYGTARNTGFLVFLDGIPQPWQMNGEGEFSYMHYVELEDNETCSFTITFTPVTGQEGDTLALNVCSVYYAQYQPDMSTTYYFGNYHKVLSSVMPVSFLADASESEDDPSATDMLENVAVTSNQMTSDFSDSLLEMYEGGSIDELLEENVYLLDTYNDLLYQESYNIEDETVHLKVQLCGIVGTTLRISMYANHELVSDGQDTTWTVTLEKGEVSTLEADIDVNQLGDLTTFYVVACCDSDAGNDVLKGHSVVLYRQED